MTTPFEASAPQIPERISELVSNCVRFVHTSVGAELDLTHETLPILDHYLRLSRTELAERPEILPLVAQTMGAYFGQVLAIEYGGQWRAVTADAHDYRLYFQSFFLMLNPVGVAYELLLESSDHPGPEATPRFARDEREAVEARLAAQPPVEHDEYFSFSTRYDIIQLCIEALREGQHTAGLEDVNYEWGDYEDELGLA